MKRKYLPEYQSLTHLVRGLTSGVNLNAQARRGSYWRNTIKVQTPGGRGSGLLLSRDGYFVTNCHVLTEEKVRNGCSITIPDVDYRFTVSRVLAKSRPHDLILAQARVHTAAVPTEIILSDYQPLFDDRIRTYGYKYEVMEEKQGKVCIGTLSSSLGDTFWQALNVHYINPDLERKAIENTIYSTCDVEPGWSGGPVVLESTGELIGFTKLISFSHPFLTLLGLASQKTHGFTSTKKLKEMIGYFLEREE